LTIEGDGSFFSMEECISPYFKPCPAICLAIEPEVREDEAVSIDGTLIVRQAIIETRRKCAVHDGIRTDLDRGA
jgi:hypothetical protein